MFRIASALLFPCLTVCMSCPGAAQAGHDLSTFLMLGTKQYQVYTRHDMGNPTTITVAVVNFPSIVIPGAVDQQWWIDRGGGPRLESSNVFSVTATSITWYGWYAPGYSKFAVISPPLTCPRFMKKGDVFTATTAVIKPTKTYSATVTRVLTGDGISITAGNHPKKPTFHGCIRLKSTFISPDSVEVESEVCAPGVGPAYVVFTELDEEGANPQIWTSIDGINAYGKLP